MIQKKIQKLFLGLALVCCVNTIKPALDFIEVAKHGGFVLGSSILTAIGIMKSVEEGQDLIKKDDNNENITIGEKIKTGGMAAIATVCLSTTVYFTNKLLSVFIK